MNWRVARQYGPRQSPRNQITAPIHGEIKTRLLLLLRGIEQFPIGGMQALIGYLVIKSEPQMNLGGREWDDPVHVRVHGCTSGSSTLSRFRAGSRKHC